MTRKTSRPDSRTRQAQALVVALAGWILWGALSTAMSTASGQVLPPSSAVAGASLGVKIHVTEVPLFRAPRPSLSLWALNISYVAPSGGGMVMTRVQCDYLGQRDWTKAIDHNQRMLSADHGRTWRPAGPQAQNGPEEAQTYHTAWMHFLDPQNGRLLALFTKSDSATGKQVKVYYEVSRDEGKTWSKARQVIQQGSGYDSTRWAPGITGKEQSLDADQAPFAKLDDGTIVCGFSRSDRRDASKDGVAYLRGRWNEEATELRWEVGQTIIGPAGAGPVCEPDLLYLGGQRLVTTMRCQGDESKGVFSTRQCAASEDGGRTWSKPWAMKYDDGATVCVPASISVFEREKATGRVYWLANILEKPVFGQGPRACLSLAEFDTQHLCLIRKTVTAIIPPCSRKPPYSNIGHYVDRQTGEFVIVPAEQDHYAVDYAVQPFFAYRVKLLP